jgi:hypothetical protein
MNDMKTLLESVVERYGENFDMFDEYKECDKRTLKSIKFEDHVHPNGLKFFIVEYEFDVPSDYLNQLVLGGTTRERFDFRNGEWQWRGVLEPCALR